MSKFDWWRRQQLIKLLAIANHDFASALVFNSDVICIADFDEMTFVEDGKLLSDWEPKSGQAWWRAAARLLGTSVDRFSPYGLSVVPNVVSCDLARLSLGLFSDRYGHLPTFLMHSGRIVTDENVCWTDFSLYTLLGEMTGEMSSYHLAADKVFDLHRRVRSDYSIWSQDEFGAKLEKLDFASPDATFMVVQSNAGINPDTIRRRLLMQG